MFKEKIQKFVKNKTEGNGKKNIENLVVFLILLIITIIAINIIWNKDEKKAENTADYKILADDKINDSNISKDNEYDLEDKLEDILSKMSGVGKVNVLITYSKTSSVIPMYSQTESTSVTEETDSARRNKETRIFKCK